MHARYYALDHAFGSDFEVKVAEGLAAFVPRLAHARNGLWCAWIGARLLGSIVIDGQDQDDGAAHLRYFIVDDGTRGRGVGRILLRAALRFVDEQGFERTRLWTFEGLNAARRLYEQQGFQLVRSWRGDQWGREVTEQVFERAKSP